MRTCQSCGTGGQSDTAAFCFSCGSALGVPGCSGCGADLPAGARFCPECGTPSSQVTAAPPPPSPVQRQGTARKITSVLFGDLVGFTTLSESRDPEEVRELLTAYFDECRAVAARYGGELEKFIGDAVMAVWGLPVTREDDAERAVRAGLELVERVTALGERIGMPGLAMRVGITTAEVAVTLGATGQSMVAGDPVNTAARIQSTAEPGEVWVDETTRTFTTQVIDYDDAGSHAMKGKAEPVPLWTARSIVAGAGGDRRDHGLEARLVGRDRELRLVKEIFHRAEETQRAAMLVIDGEPGIGKSRLGWEFEKYVDGLDAGVPWHRGRCLSYGEGVAYYALAEAVRARLTAIAGAETPDLLHEALAVGVPEQSERDWLEPRLAALLGQEASGFTREDLFTAWVAFFKYVGLLDAPPGRPGTLVLVVDDAHFADDGLLGFLDHLLAAADFPVFVLVLARPELLTEHPALAGNRRVTVVHLEPLPAPDMERLIDDLVEGMTAELRDGLVSRAEGIPLYAIETIRSLADQDLVARLDDVFVLKDPGAIDLAALAAPTTLQALIAARLDSLPPEERYVLDRASVLGLVFTDEGIAALCPDVADLDGAIAGLFRREVLRRETDRLSTDHGRYRFAQSVVRQVAYGMIARRDRKAIHLAAVTQLDAELEARPEAYELAPLIAQHLLDAIDAVANDPDVAELTRRACDQLEIAAVRASELAAPAKAAAYLATALERCEPDRRLSIQSNLARELYRSRQYAAAIEHAEEALAGFDAAGDLVGAARTADSLAMASIYGGDVVRADAVLQDLLTRLPTRPLDPDQLEARYDLVRDWGQRQIYGGNVDKLGHIAQESLELAELIGNPRYIAGSWTAMAIASSDAVPSLARLLFEQAAELAKEHHAVRERASALCNFTGCGLFHSASDSVRIGREAIEASNAAAQPSIADAAQKNLASALYLRGQWDEAYEFGTSDAVGAGSRHVSDAQLRLASHVRGAEHPDFAEASATELAELEIDGTITEYTLERAVALLSAGDPGATALAADAVRLSTAGMVIDLWGVWMVATEVMVGAADTSALAAALDSLATVEVPVPRLVRAQRARIRGLLEPAGSDVAEAYLLAGIDDAVAGGSLLLEARTCHALGARLAAQGRATDAAAHLGRARELYESLGAQRWLDELDGLG